MFAFGRWLISSGRVLAPALLLALLATAGPLSSAQADDSAAAPSRRRSERNRPNWSSPTGRSRRCGRWPLARARPNGSRRSPTDSRSCCSGAARSSCPRDRSRKASRSRSTASSCSESWKETRTRKPARRRPWRPTPRCATCSRRWTRCARAAIPRRCSRRSATRCWRRLVLAVLLWAVMRGYADRLRGACAPSSNCGPKAGAELEQPGRGPLRHRRSRGRAGQAGRMGCRPAPRVPMGGTGARILPVHATLGRRPFPQPAGRAGPLRSQHPQRSAGPAVRCADLLHNALHRARRPRILRRRAGGPHPGRAGSTRRPRVPPAGC